MNEGKNKSESPPENTKRMHLHTTTPNMLICSPESPLIVHTDERIFSANFQTAEKTINLAFLLDWAYLCSELLGVINTKWDRL